MDKLEEETQKDIEERDALSKRIKEKESKNTRHIMSKSEARSFAEAQKRLKLDTEKEEDKAVMLDKLRYESRKSYLNKRKEDKRMELEAQVRDDETLFAKEKFVFFSFFWLNILLNLSLFFEVFLMGIFLFFDNFL